MQANGTPVPKQVQLGPHQAATVHCVMRLINAMRIESDQLEGTYQQTDTATFLRGLMKTLQAFGDDYVETQGRRVLVPQPVIAGY